MSFLKEWFCFVNFSFGEEPLETIILLRCKLRELLLVIRFSCLEYSRHIIWIRQLSFYLHSNIWAFGWCHYCMKATIHKRAYFHWTKAKHSCHHSIILSLPHPYHWTQYLDETLFFFYFSVLTSVLHYMLHSLQHLTHFQSSLLHLHLITSTQGTGYLSLFWASQFYAIHQYIHSTNPTTNCSLHSLACMSCIYFNFQFISLTHSAVVDTI